MSERQQIEATLFALAKSGKSASIYSEKNGVPCVAVGRVRSVNTTHVIVGWRSGETIVPLNAITAIEEASE